MAYVEFTGKKLPLKLRRIIQREADERRRNLSVRAMRCSRGCPHGRAFQWRQHIRLYLSLHDEADKYLTIHELAHLADRWGGHTETFYREAIRIATREKCLRGFLNWQGKRAKAANRRLRAEQRKVA